MLTRSQIDENRKIIERLLRSTDRCGIDRVLLYLDESGFYEAPSSVGRHHNWRGGLAEHCLGVCKIALERNADLPRDSVVIAGILHDICKASKLYYDADGSLHRRPTHIKGHGRRSIKLLEQCGLLLMEAERLAIRWHMGGHHATPEDREELSRARRTPLWNAIRKADKLDASGNPGQ